MSVARLQIPFQSVLPNPVIDRTDEIAPLASALRRAFGSSFSFWAAETGQLVGAASSEPGSDDPLRGELCRALTGPQPQFILDGGPVLILAIPLVVPSGGTVVATAAFLIDRIDDVQSHASALALLGRDSSQVKSWLGTQSIWPSDALLRLASSVQRELAAQDTAGKLQREVEQLSDKIASTYEEICLLHGVTQNLRISSDDGQLCMLVLEWLLDCLPARGVAIQLLPVTTPGENTYKARVESTLLKAGECPLSNEQFTALVSSLQLHAGSGPKVINERATAGQHGRFAGLEQLIVVSIAEGDRIFGWLAAFNHSGGGEFGTVEASLLNSIGAMVGIHAGNRDLYRQQSEFLASVVRALSSAIDTKDPYTCGHSDRVARISVRLAKELGCDSRMLHTVYMAGLLHDIGKIGIDDAVLRKPGKLSDEEFEHVKQHPELGYRILADIQQLAGVLPAVLHHHEQWDGGGYPYHLVGDNIPKLARIVAVADAFDAMSSDRPYRKGMEPAKVEAIFRQGAGKQWDAEVIAAFFSARSDIADICTQERANLTLDVQQWV